MGSTQAAYLLMSINLFQIGNILVASGKRAFTYVLNYARERFPRPQLHRGDVALYVHIDDVGVMAGDASLATVTRDEIAAGLRAVGFSVTTDDPSADGRFVGYRPVRYPPRWEPASDKLGLLVRAIDELLYPAPQPVCALRTAVSVFVWMAQLWRPAMSMVDQAFAYCRRYADRWMWLPAAIRRELRLMRAALVFTFARLDRRPAPIVAAQDAACPHQSEAPMPGAPYGAFCLSVAAPRADEITGVMRQVDGIGRSALIPDAIGSRMRRNGLLPELKLIARTLVPLRWCDGSTAWDLFLSRPWAYPLGIEEGELRAGITWSRLLATSGVARGSEVLDLSDNQGVVCQLATGRSSRGPLNVLLRRHAAYEAVGDFRLRSAWVPTHRQPSDGGTRVDDAGRLYEGIAQWKTFRAIVSVGWDCRRKAALEAPHRRLIAHPLPRAGGTRGFMRAWIRRVLRDVECGSTAVLWWHWPRFTGMERADSIDEWLVRMCGWCLDIACSFGAVAVVSGGPGNRCWATTSLSDVIKHHLPHKVVVRTHLDATCADAARARSAQRAPATPAEQHGVSPLLPPNFDPPRHTSVENAIIAATDADSRRQQHHNIVIFCSHAGLKRRLAASCSTTDSCGVAADGLGGRLGIPAAVARCLGRLADTQGPA